MPYKKIQKKVAITIISAITQEVMKAYVLETSSKKYIKWLSYRNSRAQIDQTILPSNSTWEKMTEEDWKDYPIIVRVDKYKTPYVVDRVGMKFDIKGKITRPLFLKTVDNIKYLELMAVKKKRIQDLFNTLKAPLSNISKKKKKRKKRRIFKTEDWL